MSDLAQKIDLAKEIAKLDPILVYGAHDLFAQIRYVLSVMEKRLSEIERRLAEAEKP